MPILQEMLDIVMRVFGGADPASLIIMLVVVVGAGLALGSWGRIIQVTVGALAITGLVHLAYMLATNKTEATALPTSAWDNLKGMSVGDLVVYFLAFAIVITIVHVIRNAVQRG